MLTIDHAQNLYGSDPESLERFHQAIVSEYQSLEKADIDKDTLRDAYEDFLERADFGKKLLSRAREGFELIVKYKLPLRQYTPPYSDMEQLATHISAMKAEEDFVGKLIENTKKKMAKHGFAPEPKPHYDLRAKLEHLDFAA